LLSSVFAAVVFGWLVPANGVAAPAGPIDLLTEFDTRIDGAVEDEFIGGVVDGGGDINGDGTPDMIVSSFESADNNMRENSGSVYVVFGDPSATTIDLANLGSQGFRIDGAAEGDNAGESAAIAGDVNDDGLDDVIVGAPDADNNSRDGSGSAYVVYGKTTTTNVDLASLASGGFRIDGEQAGDAAGRSVDGGGDVDNDGIEDVLVGATGYGTAHGAVWVVYGSDTPADVDLLSYTTGFQISGANNLDIAGTSLADAGDVNDDGIDDILIGATGADNNSRNNSGSAYVVFGKENTDTVDLGSLGDGGFRIDGPVTSADGTIAHVVDGGRDINGDGFDDVVVSQSGAGNNSRPNSGSAHVVFGNSSTMNVDLASLGNGGFRIDGAKDGDQAATSVALAGDVDADGLSDVIVGATEADKNSRTSSGSAYIVLGKTSSTKVDLAELGDKGSRIDGAAADDEAGWWVARAGDVDDNGLRDVLVGAPYATHNSRPQSGSAYVELVWLEGDCANPLSGTDGNDNLTGTDYGDDITAREGADVLKGKDGNDCLEGGSGVDDLEGGEGSDTVKGGDGADESVAGGKGSDTVKGGDGKDTLDGGASADDLSGGAGNDTATGGDGGDELDGGDDKDTLKGGAGGDTLRGGAGGDTLKGGASSDTLTGGDGKDTIKSGDGADVIKAKDGDKDTIACGGGNDEVHADKKDELKSC
jgi:RTX calcium-binding nonapeptide repeat (4 copies)/FG-GAP repeat